MADDVPVSWIHRGVEFAIAAATENWGTKIMAFLLALIVFIVTRDEVTRDFTIPLRVIDDPERVLLTTPPESVELRLRGPWVNVNRIAAAEIGAATLDLREVRPGPMELDPAAIVMPPGVVLDLLEYDPVDLRFEALEERTLLIVPILVGAVDADHQLAATRVEPSSWTVRAPTSEFGGLEELHTEPIDLSELDRDVDLRVGLQPPSSSQLVFLGVAAGELPRVRVVAEISALSGELELEVATGAALRAALPELAGSELPELERVTIRGPRALLRSLEGLEPLQPSVEVEAASGPGAPVPVTLRFEWSPIVPLDSVEQLSIIPPLVRLRLSPRDPEAVEIGE